MAQVLSLAVVARNNRAYAATVGLPIAKILVVRPATALEIAQFSTAVTAVETENVNYNQRSKNTYFSVTATATVITATNA